MTALAPLVIVPPIIFIAEKILSALNPRNKRNTLNAKAVGAFEDEDISYICPAQPATKIVKSNKFQR